MMTTIALVGWSLLAIPAASYQPRGFSARKIATPPHVGLVESNTDTSPMEDRRKVLVRSVAAAAAAAVLPRGAAAASLNSRTDGYALQKTETEWGRLLSPAQYDILRNGGTERPNSSVLEGEERSGTYSCAGCRTDLFASSAKFHSGTGWPSYASALPGAEVENVSAVQASLLGAELRCGTW